jgi:16S rRNA (guanine(527)-N(7))-methyltransferase RsmG
VSEEDDFRSLLAVEFAPYQVLSAAQLTALESHYNLLCKWNKKINLCRFRDLREAVQLHYCESLFLGRFLPPEPLRIVDVGSGAGFPGFPVAVLRSDCDVDLLESDQKKAAFLREACHGLKNLRVVADRAERCASRYDWVISRAVRPDAVRKLRLAPNGALLTSESGDVKIPWGDRRFVQLFHVEL